MHKLICVNCGNRFTKRPRINGRRYVRTKYCLDCLPIDASDEIKKALNMNGRGSGKKIICRICKKKFQSNVLTTIDGIERRTIRKQHCLECVPYKVNVNKKFNTKGQKFQCQICEKKFVYGVKPNLHSSKECNRCKNQKYSLRTKFRALQYKGFRCLICGYDKNTAAMVFHHRDLKKKDMSFGQFSAKSWPRMKKELDKCDLLCANCHMEVHNPIDKIHNKLVKIIYGDLDMGI